VESSGNSGAAAFVSRDELQLRLFEFLDWWLGRWPPRRQLDVAGSPQRSLPGWDGEVRPLVGVATPEGSLISVPEDRRAEVDEAASRGALPGSIGEILGIPDARLVRGVFRWSEYLVDLPAAGEWVSPGDGRLPGWLRPFNGDVLVAFDETGRFAAGVGRKHHSDLGIEIAVGTEPEFRGRGLARRLVAQATRRIVGEGAVALYLHAASNVSSAAVAEASGFPDRGWEFIDLASAARAADDEMPEVVLEREREAR
jgi:GNAT superfamily N-acetyltransferase